MFYGRRLCGVEGAALVIQDWAHTLTLLPSLPCWGLTSGHPLAPHSWVNLPEAGGVRGGACRHSSGSALALDNVRNAGLSLDAVVMRIYNFNSGGVYLSPGADEHLLLPNYTPAKSLRLSLCSLALFHNVPRTSMQYNSHTHTGATFMQLYIIPIVSFQAVYCTLNSLHLVFGSQLLYGVNKDYVGCTWLGWILWMLWRKAQWNRMHYRPMQFNTI